MNKSRIFYLSLAITLTAGCANLDKPLDMSNAPVSKEPLKKYAWDGQFYSEHYTEAQILNMESSKAVSVRHLKLPSGGCGSYSGQDADKMFVIEPIKQKMHEINALAVRNIRVSEKPATAGCFNWNVEGEFYQAASNGKVSTAKPSSDKYTSTENETRDLKTGLIWQKEDDGRTRSWDDAIKYCNNLPLAGHSDWRLPSIDELKTIVDSSQNEPKIDTTHFPNTKTYQYWSSTPGATFETGITTAHFVNFKYGNENNFGREGHYYVRCVRFGSRDDSARLQKLKDMRAGGVITEEEYNKKRKEILDAM